MKKRKIFQVDSWYNKGESKSISLVLIHSLFETYKHPSRKIKTVYLKEHSAEMLPLLKKDHKRKSYAKLLDPFYACAGDLDDIAKNNNLSQIENGNFFRKE